MGDFVRGGGFFGGGLVWMYWNGVCVYIGRSVVVGELLVLWVW